MEQRSLKGILFVFLFALYLLIAALRIDTGDGELMYQVARSMRHEKGFSVPSPIGEDGFYGMWGIDNRYHSPTGWGASLSVLPFYWLGDLAHRHTGWATQGYLTRASVLLRNVLTGALTGCTLFALARQIGYSKYSSIVSALAIVLATPFVVYVKTMFSEPLITLCLLLSLLFALRASSVGKTRLWLLAGIVLGFGLLVKPIILIVVPVFITFVVWECSGATRWKTLIIFLMPILLGYVAMGWYNAVRFGDPFSTGYPSLEFDGLPWVGLYGLLLSPGKGLLWFCPVIVPGIAGWFPLTTRRPKASLLMLGTALLFLMSNSFYRVWHGGGGWGPRLILPIVPLLVLPLSEWLERECQPKFAQMALALLLVLSFLVQVPAVLVHWGRTAQAVYTASDSEEEYNYRILYRVSDSLVWRQWGSFLEVSALMRNPYRRTEVFETVAALGQAEARSQFSVDCGLDSWTATVGLLAFNSFDFWWVYWLALGVSPVIVILIVGGLLIVLWWSGWLLFCWMRNKGDRTVGDWHVSV